MTTRDELRAQCIKAMADALESCLQDSVDHALNTFRYGGDRSHWIDAATAAFDALHGIAWVNPVKATDKMLAAARNYFRDGLTAYEAISIAGDLVNAPEQKP